MVRPVLGRRVLISGCFMKMHPFPRFIGGYPLSLICLGQVIRRWDFHHNGDQESWSSLTAERGLVMGGGLWLTENAKWSRKLGASVGWGLVQGRLILGGQFLGCVTGEWRGVGGKPRRQIYVAIVLLIVAMDMMAATKAV
jgi:hypothetical protein